MLLSSSSFLQFLTPARSACRSITPESREGDEASVRRKVLCFTRARFTRGALTIAYHTLITRPRAVNYVQIITVVRYRLIKSPAENGLSKLPFGHSCRIYPVLAPLSSYGDFSAIRRSGIRCSCESRDASGADINRASWRSIIRIDTQRLNTGRRSVETRF